jgi:hypothetical protein
MDKLDQLFKREAVRQHERLGAERRVYVNVGSAMLLGGVLCRVHVARNCR